jgi:hypothetical protein
MKQWIQKGNHQATIFAVVIGFAGFLFQIFLQTILRPYTADGLHFQIWSSETMMQTVALEDLYTAPLETLWNLHIQPPALDALRAVLVQLWPSTDPLVAVSHVDLLLYWVWSLLYGILGSLIFIWLQALTNNYVGIVAVMVVLLHPASIFFTTLLDATLLSTLLVTLMYYSLGKVRWNDKKSFMAISFVVLAILFTRAIFQWPFIFLFAVSLIMVGMQRRRVMAFMAITFAVFGLYLLKQQIKFGISSTSSFTGYNLTRSVGGDFDYVGYLDSTADVSIDRELPVVLSRTTKSNGATNLNHISYLALNQELINDYLEYMRSAPIGLLAVNYLENLEEYLRPSSDYTRHVIVDRLPWRTAYEIVFSSPILVILFVIAGLNALRKAVATRQLIRYTGLALPAAYIFAVSVLAERGENMRFKYFIEPVIIVFIIYQFYDLWQILRSGQSTESSSTDPCS